MEKIKALIVDDLTQVPEGLRNVALQPKAYRDGYRPFPNVAWRNGMQELLEVPLLVRLLDLPVGRRILEVGCGRGIALPALSQLSRPAHLTGLDIDRGLLDEAAQRLNTRQVQADLVHSDMREMPFPDESFDIVVDFGTCYHIAHPDRALNEIARVLSFGGVFVCETPASQLLSHPMRSLGRMLPWSGTPCFVPHRNAILWSSRVKR